MRQRPITDDENRACIQAIAAAYPNSVPSSSQPAIAWAREDEAETVFFIDFVDPSDVKPGGIYATWTVTIKRGTKNAEVSFFRSRVRPDGKGRDTLPPGSIPPGK